MNRNYPIARSQIEDDSTLHLLDQGHKYKSELFSPVDIIQLVLINNLIAQVDKSILVHF